MGVQPCVKSGLRLLDQHHPRQTGLCGRFDGELSGDLVERRRQRQHDVLLGQGVGRKPRVPGTGDVLQVLGACFDRREPLHVGRPMPGQQAGRAVHSRMTQPRLGRRDQPARHQRALVAGKEAHRRRRFPRVPGTFQRPRGKLALRRLVQKRRQRLPRLNLPGRNHLRHGKCSDPPRRLGSIHIRYRRVRRAQIDAHHIAGWRSGR